MNWIIKIKTHENYCLFVLINENALEINKMSIIQNHSF